MALAHLYFYTIQRDSTQDKVRSDPFHDDGIEMMELVLHIGVWVSNNHFLAIFIKVGKVLCVRTLS